MLSLVEGLTGSCSRMTRCISAVAGLAKLLFAEWSRACQKLIEQYTQRVDVGAGVYVQIARALPAQGSCRQACR